MSAKNVSAPESVRRFDRRDAATDHRQHANHLQPALPGERGRAIRPGISWLDSILSTRKGALFDQGSVPFGREHPSRTWHADGGPVRNDCGASHSFGPQFDRAVPSDGYAWWYLDAISDDGRNAITLIAFIGSVFSPYYALKRRQGPAAPQNHCAMNVALYGTKRRWAMTERASHALLRDANLLKIGPSSMRWDGSAFRISLDEVTAPLPSRIRGTITLTPEVHNLQSFALSDEDDHFWWPLMPRARIEVDLPMPGLAWSGSAYLDCNWGAAPLESTFRHWSWSRTECADGSSEIFYDVVARNRRDVNLALRVRPDGVLEEITAPAMMHLQKTGWRLARPHRCDDKNSIRCSTALEDGPFYSRTLIETSSQGQTSKTVHESLCLERFSSPWVQAMLPFRMPRYPALAARTVVLMARIHARWLATVASNRRAGSDQLHYNENDANRKNRQHLDQAQVLGHEAPWFRFDLHAQALIELFLRLEQRDAAARGGAVLRTRV